MQAIELWDEPHTPDFCEAAKQSNPLAFLQCGMFGSAGDDKKSAFCDAYLSAAKQIEGDADAVFRGLRQWLQETA